MPTSARLDWLTIKMESVPCPDAITRPYSSQTINTCWFTLAKTIVHSLTLLQTKKLRHLKVISITRSRAQAWMISCFSTLKLRTGALWLRVGGAQRPAGPPQSATGSRLSSYSFSVALARMDRAVTTYSVVISILIGLVWNKMSFRTISTRSKLLEDVWGNLW